MARLHRCAGGGLSVLSILCGAAGLAGCALPPLHAGMSEAEVSQAWGVASARHPLPGGGSRLEYPSGPYGKVTWMVELDAAGRVVGSEQVLTEAHFAQAGLGMSMAEVRGLLGRPVDRLVDFRRRQTWYWRYENMQCLWFGVTFSAQGLVIEGGSHTVDPICEPREPPRWR